MILLDVDGVLANFIGSLIASLGLDISHDDWVTYDHHRTLGLTDDQMWAATRTPGWWSELYPYPWAHEIMSRLREIDPDIIFSTAPSADPKCAAEKIDWLRSYGFMGSRNDFMIGPHKHLMAKSGALLIDDSDKNIAAFRTAGGLALTFPQPWNSLRDIRREENWLDLVVDAVGRRLRGLV